MQEKNKFDTIFGATQIFSTEELVAYVTGKMPPAQMQQVERFLLEDEVANEVVEGLQLLHARGELANTLKSIEEAHLALLEKKNVKIIGINKNYFYAIAATLLLLVVSGYFFTNYFKSLPEQQLAMVDTSKFATPEASPIEMEKDESATANSEQKEKRPTSPIQNIQKNSNAAEGISASSATQQLVLGDDLVSAKQEESVNNKTTVAEEQDKNSPGAGDEPSATNQVVLSKQTAPASTMGASGAGAAPQKAAPLANVKDEKDKKRKASRAESTRGKNDQAQMEAAPSEDAAVSESAAEYEKVTTKSNNDSAILQQGILFMNSKNYTSALANFEQIILNSSSKLAEDAEWNKALCLVEMKQVEKAKKVLTLIASKNLRFASAAKQKLLELK